MRIMFQAQFDKFLQTFIYSLHSSNETWQRLLPAKNKNKDFQSHVSKLQEVFDIENIIFWSQL